MGRLEPRALPITVRLLLDEHLSGRRIGAPLRRRGHDVVALHEEPAAWGLTDEDVLERATAARRIVVTRNGRDFVALARAWAAEQRSHAGILVLSSFHSTAFGETVEAVHDALASHPLQQQWIDLVLAA